MNNIPIINQEELVGMIKTKLESKPYKASYSHFSEAPAQTESAAYVLILGAGFSYGIVPLVNELMQQTIGDYYYPDQDQSSVERPARVLRKDSAHFWAEFNEAAVGKKLPIVELDGRGLPKNPGAAYQRLFAYDGANVLFAQTEPEKRNLSFLESLEQQRAGHQAPKDGREKRSNTGERFVKGFLRYVLDPGSEHGSGSTGRNRLNSAHFYLASLLEAQQLGQRWRTCAFCRTIFTTNFDTLLQNALQMVNLLYCLTDRPEKGISRSDFHLEEGPIHLVYVHGSILRHNPASTLEELGGLAKKNIEVLQDYLGSSDIIVIGYSGWNDGLMTALHHCDSSQQKLYWCDVRPKPTSHVASLLKKRADSAVYVNLGKEGSDGLMRALYETLVPAKVQRDPIKRYQDWSGLVWNR